MDAPDDFVQQAPEAEHIGPRVERFTAHLLRRHVGHGAGDDAGLGENGRGPGLAVSGQRQLRQAEVEHLHLRARRQHDVVWLDVAVDDPLPVRFRKRGRDLADDGERGLEVERLALQPGGQRLALDVLHGDEAVPVRIADVIYGADVGMVERRGRLRLAQQALAGHVVGGEGRRQDF